MNKGLSLDSWQIEGETSTLFIASFCVLFALYLGMLTWVRMKKNRKIALWEIFRFLIILLLIVTLLNPTRVEKLESSKKSQIVCLHDVSESMETKDIIINDGENVGWYWKNS